MWLRHKNKDSKEIAPACGEPLELNAKTSISGKGASEIELAQRDLMLACLEAGETSKSVASEIGPPHKLPAPVAPPQAKTESQPTQEKFSESRQLLQKAPTPEKSLKKPHTLSEYENNMVEKVMYHIVAEDITRLKNSATDTF
jgi:hypothetical protein